LSRQPLPFQARSSQVAANIGRGGYVLSESVRAPSAVLVSTGSELQLAIAAQKLLAETGTSVRVVSMPSSSVFDRQNQTYRDQVLPPGVPVIAIEAAAPDSWYKYVGRSGAVIGISCFGESAPAPELFEYFGFNPTQIVARIKSLLDR
jgi:transketolase